LMFARFGRKWESLSLRLHHRCGDEDVPALLSLPMAAIISAMPEQRRLNVDLGAVKARPIIRRGIPRVSVSLLAVGLRYFVHVEQNTTRNIILAHKEVAGSENACLDELIGLRRKRFDRIVGRAEVMKGPIRITENLEMHRSLANIFVIGFDPYAGLVSLN
jgi:hypothetical protein